MTNEHLIGPLFMWTLILFLTFYYIGGILADHDGYKHRESYNLCESNLNYESSRLPIVYLAHENDSTEVFINLTYSRNRIDNYNCLMLFRTCSDCQIRAEPVGLFFSYPSCRSRHLSNIYDGHCAKGCAYLHLFDADYQKETSLIMSKWNQLRNYSSESRQLHVFGCGNQFNSSVLMRLRLSVQKKEKIIKLQRWSPISYISSPFFPNSYTLNEEQYTYYFKATDDGQITVIFDDWLISPYSYLQFYDASIVGKITGSQNRPYIISIGRNMKMIFNTGPMRYHAAILGFSAVVKYYPGWQIIPPVNFDCDHTFKTAGGVIKFDEKMANGQLFDCIWIITKPYDGYAMVQIKLEQFSFGPDDDVEIEIKDGLTSKGLRKLYANGAVYSSGQATHSPYISAVGFYIRLKGQFIEPSPLIISYSSYSYGCSPYSFNFKCKNDRCISEDLKCDGHDHCGDHSDETTALCGPPEDDPKPKSRPSITVGVIIPIVVSVVLVFVICLVFLFVRRCQQLSIEERRTRSSRSQAGRHLRRDQNVQMSVTVSSGDLPPSYNEVIQNPPVGQFNMAFSWSGMESDVPQPPSYNEAIGLLAPDLPVANMTLTGNSQTHDSVPQERNERAIDVRNERAIDVGGLESHGGTTANLSSLLDPNLYVSSSSSSEYLSDRRGDSLSSTDSSLDNNNSFATNMRGRESKMTNQDADKEEAKDRDMVLGQVDILLSPSSIVKFKSEKDYGVNDAKNLEDTKTNQPNIERRRLEVDVDANERNRAGTQINELSNLQSQSQPESTHGRNNNNPANYGRSHGQSTQGRNNNNPANYGRSHGQRTQRRNNGNPANHRHEQCETDIDLPSDRGIEIVNNRERIDQRQRRDERMTEVPRGRNKFHDDKLNETNDRRERGNQSRKKYGISPENLRSQSLADVSLGGRRGISLAPNCGTGTDKRFSYAGTATELEWKEDVSACPGQNDTLGTNHSHQQQLRDGTGKLYANHKPRGKLLSTSPPSVSSHEDGDNVDSRDFPPHSGGYSDHAHAMDREHPRQHMHSGELLNQQIKHSSTSSSEQSLPSPTHSQNDRNRRPKPIPRRNVRNSSVPREGDRQSRSTPLSVTNYIEPKNEDQKNLSGGNNQTGKQPLAQLVFKATDDDVYI